MNYFESIAYIESLSPTLERPSLTRIEAFVRAHDNLHRQSKAFHIGGTNGKGSTAAIVDCLLRRCRYRVGRFTGPHLLRWNERFHVDGTPISDEDFARIATTARKMSEQFGADRPDLGPLTWFEFLTAMAFLFFAERNVEIAVFEVGLGGRFDATNVLQDVLCSAVTSIDLDHTHILGNTVREIAFEKSGIFKHDVPAVTAATGEALDELRERAQMAGAPFYTCALPNELAGTASSGTMSDETWSLLKKEFSSCVSSLSLLGDHQKLNALVGVSALYLGATRDEELRQRVAQQLLSESGLRKAFANVYWPGRFQLIPEHNLILDGAHNPSGAATLRQALDTIYPSHMFSFVISCFANKNVGSIVRALLRPGDRVYAAEAATRRATCPVNELVAIAQEIGCDATACESIAAAVQKAKAASSAIPIVATGSFATVKESMEYLGWNSVETAAPDRLKSLAEA